MSDDSKDVKDENTRQMLIPRTTDPGGIIVRQACRIHQACRRQLIASDAFAQLPFRHCFHSPAARRLDAPCHWVGISPPPGGLLILREPPLRSLRENSD
jgi:hypothetical protein